MVILDTTGKVVSSATIETDPATLPLDRVARYRTIWRQLEALLGGYKTLKVCIEGFSFGSRGRGLTGLAELRGVLLDHMADLTNDIQEVPPASLKQFFTGSGKASKEDMLAAALEHGFDCGKDHNQADAYALAQWAHQGMKTKPKAKKPRKTKPKCKSCGDKGTEIESVYGFPPETVPCSKCKKTSKKKQK